MLTDEQLLRYSRHLLLPELDAQGQLAICQSRALVLGLGGLGSPVAMYLAASGVGELVLVDHDEVELSNLQRQVIHTCDRLGQTKVASAAKQIELLNDSVKTHCIAEKLDEVALREQVQLADVVLDCTDNFTSRKLTNRVCVEEKTPLVSGAAIRLEAQLTTFDSRDEHSPCYQCLYEFTGEENLSCSESGVLSPLVGAIGSLQALEALKVLAKFGEPLVGRVQFFDALNSEWRTFKLNRDPNCTVCSQKSIKA